jgi:hypothetical protein
LIYTDCIGSYKSNYHTITTMTVSFVLRVVMTFRIYIKKNMRNLILNELVFLKKTDRDRHGRDRMVVGFITTYAISIYQH